MRTHHLLAAALAAAVLAGCGGGSDSTSPVTYNVAVFGDLPYGTSATDTTQTDLLPGYIAKVNADKSVALALHAGDIHSGKQYCTQAYDQQIFTEYNKLAMPLVYTPGDNEWADCHKAKEGGGTYNATTFQIDYVKNASGAYVDYAAGDPVANLDLVRSIFFANPGKTIGGAMTVHTQAQDYDTTHPTDKQYVENTWFIKDGVLYVAANIPGGSNNGTDVWYGAPTQSPAQMLEIANRTAATLRWLDTAFTQAKAQGAKAMVILEQADLWDLDGNTTAHIANHLQYIDVIAKGAAAFKNPVLLINGDSHLYRSDNPLKKSAGCWIETGSGTATTACSATTLQSGAGNPADPYDTHPAANYAYDVPNFHRLVVHGSTTPMEWVKLSVDTSQNAAASATAFGPFSWSRQQ